MTQDCQEEAGLDRIREHKNRILALGVSRAHLRQLWGEGGPPGR